MITEREMHWIFTIAIVFMNVTDLIRGPWFFTNITSIIFWNVILLATIFLLATGNKNGKRKK